MMVVLHPVIRDGIVVPNQFEDPYGGNEPGYSREMSDGEIVYSHESGYGYLREHQVCIMAHLY